MLPDTITFIHSEDLERRYPDLTPKEREKLICKEHQAVFVIGIGAELPVWSHVHGLASLLVDGALTLSSSERHDALRHAGHVLLRGLGCSPSRATSGSAPRRRVGTSRRSLGWGTAASCAGVMYGTPRGARKVMCAAWTSSRCVTV